MSDFARRFGYVAVQVHLNGKDDTMRSLLILLGRSRWAVFVLLVCKSTFAQYSINWFTVDGGGGTSTGSVYSVSGTIGQHDAGNAMSGGNYSLTGGFWSLVAVVQTPGAPLLTITHSGNSVIVSWPVSPGGFTVQQNSNLANPAGWSAYSGTVSTNNGVVSTTVTPPVGNLFFRLHHP
jgi:hypothetical protein